MTPKLIHCDGHEPLLIQRDYRQPWSDTYIHWAGRGREVKHLGPTLTSMPTAMADIALTEQCQRESPELDYRLDILRGDRLVADALLNGYSHDLRGGYALQYDRQDAPWVHPDGAPEIVVDKEYINRDIAEDMLRWFMADVYGFKHVRFKWHRITGNLILHPA